MYFLLTEKFPDENSYHISGAAVCMAVISDRYKEPFGHIMYKKITCTRNQVETGAAPNYTHELLLQRSRRCEFITCMYRRTNLNSLEADSLDLLNSLKDSTTLCSSRNLLNSSSADFYIIKWRCSASSGNSGTILQMLSFQRIMLSKLCPIQIKQCL